MSLEEIDIEILYDRQQLQQLTNGQLCKLLSITVKQLKSFGFSKENLIEMFLSSGTT